MSAYSTPVGPAYTGSSGGGLTQLGPFTGAAILGSTTGYSVSLNASGGRGGVAWSQATGSADLTVSIYGVVTTTGALPVGGYTASGTMADIYGDTGTWTFTLNVGAGYTLPAAGINIAFGGNAFSSTPSWTRIDTTGTSGLPTGVAAWTVDRGRASMLDTTQAGTATITILDSDGTYDSTNPASPFYGLEPPFQTEIGPMRPVSIQLFNPVNKHWYSIFTGFTEQWVYSFPNTPSNTIMQALVNCSDGFEPLSRAEMVPDSSNGTTFSATVGLNSVKLRMLAVLAQFQSYTGGSNLYPTDPNAMFSGNINILPAVYAAHTALLTGLQDAADAEFPGVANLFMDKFGNVAYRGRVPRFNPDLYSRTGGGPADISQPPTASLPIQFWTVGDLHAANTFNGSGGLPGPTVPCSDIGWTLDNTALVNVCQCYPTTPDGTASASEIVGNTSTFPESVSLYGPRLLAIPDLYTGGTQFMTTGNPYLEPAGLTPLQETKLFGDYYVNNLQYPAPRITTLKFVTQQDATTQGNAWWHFVTGVEIGDVITVYVTDPGGGGFNATQFFVEGLHYQVTPGNLFQQITLTVDVSPREWFNYFNGFYFAVPGSVFGPVYANAGPTVPGTSLRMAASDGNVMNGNVDFSSLTGPFDASKVGQTIIIQDLGTVSAPVLPPVTYQYTIVTVSSSISCTLSAPYGGATVGYAPWEIVPL